MGIIVTRTNNAFDKYHQERKLEKLLLALMDIADRSVRSETNRHILDDAVRNNIYCRYPNMLK